MDKIFTNSGTSIDGTVASTGLKISSTSATAVAIAATSLTGVNLSVLGSSAGVTTGIIGNVYPSGTAYTSAHNIIGLSIGITYLGAGWGGNGTGNEGSPMTPSYGVKVNAGSALFTSESTSTTIGVYSKTITNSIGISNISNYCASFYAATATVTSIPNYGTNSPANYGYYSESSAWAAYNYQFYSAGIPTSRAFTNDVGTGSNIVLNMTSTAGFSVGSSVVVSSSNGSDLTNITAIVENTSITVGALSIDHSTSNQLVSNGDSSGYFVGGAENSSINLITAGTDTTFSLSNNWSGTDWAFTNTSMQHTAGVGKVTALTLENANLTAGSIKAGRKYVIIYGIKRWTAGSLIPYIGAAAGVKLEKIYSGNNDNYWYQSVTIIAGADNADISFVPDFDFNGSICYVYVVYGHIDNYARLYSSALSTLDLATDVSGTQTTHLQLTLEKSKFFNDVEIPSTNAYYLGDTTTDGSWRFIRSGTNLVIERRESASWVTKSTISA